MCRSATTTLIGKVPGWNEWSLTTRKGGLQKPSSFGSEVPPGIWTVDFSSQQYGTPSLTNCSPLFLHNCLPPFLPIYSPIFPDLSFLSWRNLFLLSIYWTTFTLTFSLLGWRWPLRSKRPGYFPFLVAYSAHIIDFIHLSNVMEYPPCVSWTTSW